MNNDQWKITKEFCVRTTTPQDRWPARILWGLFLLVCYAPVAAMLFSDSEGHADAPSLWTIRRATLLGSSLLLAVLVACAAMVLAVPLGAALWRAPQRAARVARWALLGWIVVPPCVQAMAWLGVWRWCNGVMASCGFLDVPLTGWCAAGFLQTLAFLPLAVALAWLGFELIDHQLLEAARMQRGEGAVLWHVALPLAAPGLLAGGGLVCLLSLLDFSLPSLCGVTVYTLDLFAEYSSNGAARRALMGALPLVLACAAILSASQGIFRNAASTRRREEPPVGRPAQGFLWSLSGPALALLLLLPVLALVIMSWGGSGLGAAWASARKELTVSLRIALWTALLALGPALAVAETLSARGWRSRVAWLAATLPLAIPPPLIGIGWALLSARVGAPLQGSSALPVLAALTRFLPLAALILLVARRRLDPLLWDAARVFQPSPTLGFWYVRLPLLRCGLMAAAALTVALTLGELGATLVVVPPGESTLTLRLYNFLHYGASAHVAALGMLLALLAGLAGVVAGWCARSAPTMES